MQRILLPCFGVEMAREFLRSFSIHGNLASYFPPVLEKLGLVEVYKKGRALYVRRKAATPAT